METIWKFPIAVADKQVIPMPIYAQILNVQIQNGQPCIWAKLDPEEKTKDRVILTVGTGHELPDALKRFIGIYQLGGGVFHVFEMLGGAP